MSYTRESQDLRYGRPLILVFVHAHVIYGDEIHRELVSLQLGIPEVNDFTLEVVFTHAIESFPPGAYLVENATESPYIRFLVERLPFTDFWRTVIQSA